MENQDKLYKQFRDASEKSEDKGFARMDAVWNRVEEKLDNEKHRRAAAWWKYTGIAASFLLFMTIGFFILQDDKNTITAPNAVPQNNVTTDENKKEVITTIDTAKIEQVLGVPSQSTIVSNEGRPVAESDSISFTAVSKKARIYREKNKQEVAPVTGYAEVSTASADMGTASTGDIVMAPPINESFKAKEIANQQIHTGVISDDAGPLPGATVTVKGTGRVTQTDIDGSYSIAAKKGEILEFSYIGYDSKDLVVADRKSTDITLAATTLNEVKIDTYKNINPNKSVAGIEPIEDRPNASVLQSLQGQVAGLNIAAGSGQPGGTTGYDVLANGSIQNRPLPVAPTQNYISSTSEVLEKIEVGNVSIAHSESHYFRDGDRQSLPQNTTGVFNGTITEPIDPAAVENISNAEVLQSLQGYVAGINISGESVQPQAGGAVILRGTGTLNGNAEPLFVIDGVPTDVDSFRNFDSSDIASFTVIKDAAATSIYGNRGANGVIVITSKSGSGIDGEVNALTALEQDIEDRFLWPKMTADGYNEPLYILDGVPVKRRHFSKIKPEDIDTVTILQNGAAEVLYGEEGANGVMMVRTLNPSEEGQRRMERIHRQLDKLGPGSYKEFTPNPKVKVDNEEYDSFNENQFENPAVSPLSTFSIDVDNASYTNVRRFLNNGQSVPKDAVRVEEMINFFKYEYPQPTGDEPFSINTEYSVAPWNPNHKLLRIGLQGKIIPDAALPASNFVFLIDVSGSMSDQNKLPLLKQSMKVLVSKMRSQDRIAIVVYAGAAGLVLPSTSGDNKKQVYDALDNLSAGGSTAGGAGIELAYKIAGENFVKGGNNRVILATDGDFNVGASSDKDMQELIEEKRQSGVFLTCLGYGMGNLKDAKLETLADKGNGNYAYIDTMQEADRFLNKEFKGSMYAIAKDVKIQIEFNPKHVQSYRLIGYENRKLRDEDFANDAIDAGELGSGHTVTALYEIIPAGVQSSYFTPAPELKYSQPANSAANYSDELATIKFRHKKPNEEMSTEMVKKIPDLSLPLQNASADFRFCAAVAWFGLKLRDSKLVSDKATENIKSLAKQAVVNDPEGYKAEFIRLVNMVE